MGGQSLGQVVTPPMGVQSGAGDIAARIQELGARAVLLQQQCGSLLAELRALSAPRDPGPSASSDVQADYRRAMDAWKRQHTALQQRAYQLRQYVTSLEQDVIRLGKEPMSTTQAKEYDRLQEGLAGLKGSLAQVIAMAGGKKSPPQTTLRGSSGMPAQGGGLPTQ